MKLTTCTLLFLLICSAVAFAQEGDQPCDGLDCPSPTPQLDIHTDSDVSKAAIGLPGGVNLGESNGTLNQNLTNLLRGEQVRSGEKNESENRETLTCPGPNCPRLPEEPPTEFQKFVFVSTGKRLKIYGRSLFGSVPTTFAPIDRVPVPADYVIGPGDELIIRAWGQIDFNTHVIVDRNGQVYLPKVGTLNVAGVRYDRLTAYLKNNISSVFKNFDLNVTMGQLRSIQIFVVGQARRPGTYTVSSLSTLVNALFASGGPSVNGSMRHVQLKRSNQVVTEFDLYNLLADGDKSKDMILLPGDVVYIPPVGKQVAVLGSVNLPGIYEIDDTTTLRSQLELAGGLSTTADGNKVLIQRIDHRTVRTVDELKLDETSMARGLKDGDIVQVFPVSPRFDNSVVLRGNVAQPGRFPWHAGMRVVDMIPSRESLITRAYWLRQNKLALDPRLQNKRNEANQNPANQNVTRTGNDQREDWDLNEDESANADWTQRTGRRREQSLLGQKATDEETTEATSLSRNQSEINWDYAVIERMNPQDLSEELVPFNLGRAISDPTSKDNLELQGGDVITVFAQTDLAVPTERRTKFITVQGEVNAPGVYRIEPNETLPQVLSRAGGLTSNAYLYATEFTRVSTRQEQQKRLQDVVDDMERELRSKATTILTAASASGEGDQAAAAREQLMAEQQLIERMKRVKATGRIVLNLHPDDRDISSLPNVPLRDGDEVLVPSKPSTVMVVGSVYNQNAMLYQDGENLSRYLGEVGGPTKDADRGRMFVVRADGTVVSSQMRRSVWAGSFGSTEIYPGDTIIVPERIRTGNGARAVRDWTQIFSQFALGAAALKVIVAP